MSTPDSSPLEALERFIAENDDLLKLEEMIGRFNVFDALGVARAEIRHSNFLAWLLDPAESHGHGDLFLKAVVMDLLRKTRPEMRPLSPVELDGTDLAKVQVRREWPAKLDLCISCGSPEFVIAIENKVDASEHGDQLAAYARAVSEEFGGVKCLRVFLTRDGSEPSDPTWCTYTYEDVHRVLSRVQRVAGGSVGGDVGVFLKHYLNLIGSQFMDNPDIVELCRRIYQNHRRAIDLINVHAPVAGSEGLAPIAEWIDNQRGAWVVREHNKAYLKFVPESWIGQTCGPDGRPLPTTPCDVYLECHRDLAKDVTKVKARLIVGIATDQAKRRRLIEGMTALGLQPSRTTQTEKYTRFESRTFASWDTDTEIPREKIAAEMERWISSVQAHLGHLPKLILMP